jgi:hypothetical protein
LQDLAEVIDYYGCQESLERVIDSLLNDFATPNIRDRMTFTATVHVTSAAYMLDDSRYFRLFTKRLVIDYTEPFEDAEFAERLPDTVIFGLDGQCRQSWYRLQIVVNGLSKCQCKHDSVICLRGEKDRLFVNKLLDCLLPPGTAWPKQREDGITLRHLLTGLFDLERMQRVGWCEEHRKPIHDTVGPNELRKGCQDIDNTDAVGLCLPCIRKSQGEIPRSKCEGLDENKHLWQEWVRGDSFRAGTGAAERT